MRNLLLASALLASLLPATGCILGCGAFSGGSDQVYQRNTEMMIVCGNGGFVANLSNQTIEGRMELNADGTAQGVKGDDMSLAFDWITMTDGTKSAPQLGDGNWSQVSLDQTALDHADVQCSDLETRTWWAQQ